MMLDDCDTGRVTTGAILRPLTAIGALVALELLTLAALKGAWLVIDHPGPASLDEGLVLVVLLACVLLLGWLVLGTAIACAAHLPGPRGATARRWSRAVAPAATRRLAAVLVGAALSGTMTPATAAGTADPPTGPERSPGFALTVSPPSVALAPSPSPAPASAPVPTRSSEPEPGWTPSRPVHASASVARLVTTGSTARTSEVVVLRGDTLWSVARRHLGPGASDAEVAAAWPHWYAANRDVIGPDPDVLLPGQVLRRPDRSQSAGKAVGAHP
jgi:hypothetical protein